MNERHSKAPAATKKPPSDLDHALDELASLREQLDALREELVWANRLTTLGTMAAVLAHEYNNLLTPIGSYAQLAIENPDDTELTRKALQASAEGVAKARAVAQATLAFARPDQSDEEQTQTGTLHQAIAQAQECLKHALKQDQIELCINAADNKLAIQTLRLQQVLVNLIDNARKALSTQPSQRRVTVSGETSDGGMLITVADNGPGIDANLINNVFQAFVTQAKPDTTTSQPQAESGTGLGLRVCKDIIESAGGWITADSEPGHGAAFRFWLPLAA